jgi:ribosomal protein S12 methylthiotransferase
MEGLGQGVSIGRSYRDAPEIDGLVLVQGEIPAGQIIPVRIDEAMTYDLKGTAVLPNTRLKSRTK